MTIREELEKIEQKILSPKACLSARSKGRVRPEAQHVLRTDFQRDRDRIIHSKSFRRLKHKTQVFLSPFGDHYRTRLTHCLEVSQIARTIAKALRLNEDLTEAIALGHDLGHTPFGHAGEQTLRKLLPHGFHHADQSLRVVEKLEYDGKGLNLTFEVRDGIQRHSKGRGEIFDEDVEDMPSTLEGQIVRVSDVIAYVNHDIDDALRAGIIKEEDIPAGLVKVLGKWHATRIDRMVIDVVEASLSDGPGADRHERPDHEGRRRAPGIPLPERLFQLHGPRRAAQDREDHQRPLRLHHGAAGGLRQSPIPRRIPSSSGSGTSSPA